MGVGLEDLEKEVQYHVCIITYMQTTVSSRELHSKTTLALCLAQIRSGQYKDRLLPSMVTTSLCRSPFSPLHSLPPPPASPLLLSGRRTTTAAAGAPEVRNCSCSLRRSASESVGWGRRNIPLMDIKDELYMNCCWCFSAVFSGASPKPSQLSGRLRCHMKLPKRKLECGGHDSEHLNQKNSHKTNYIPLLFKLSFGLSRCSLLVARTDTFRVNQVDTNVLIWLILGLTIKNYRERRTYIRINWSTLHSLLLDIASSFHVYRTFPEFTSGANQIRSKHQLKISNLGYMK